ncbi:MAG: NADP-dependent oxidoreductase [Actinomycetia bacterium]|nr:NADP-dependent oxidoreductase [Actinomycetes bacterium]
MASTHRRWVFVRRPEGMPTGAEFRLEEVPTPDPDPGQILVRTRWISVDPYMRGRMRAGPSYAPPWEVGEVPRGGAVGEVVASRRPGFAPGDVVVGTWGWEEMARLDGHGLTRWPWPDLSPTLGLGMLGMPGLTAYFGLFEVGRPRPGDTVVVSAAAGAVGSVVGQLARLAGCRAVGIAGSAEKVAFVRDVLRFDAAVSYQDPQWTAALEAACPDGVDVYFDNVGGSVTEAVMDRLALRARVVVCGQIARYNQEGPAPVTRDWLWQTIAKRIRVEGFLVGDFALRHAEALERLAAWVRSGRLVGRETVVEGFERVPEALLGLFRGTNVGKQLVRVAGS